VCFGDQFFTVLAWPKLMMFGFWLNLFEFLLSDPKRSRVESMWSPCDVLQITHGPVYVVRLSGQIAIPALHMSFATYDFGHCFVYKAGMSVKTAQLKLSNADDKDLMYVSLHFWFVCNTV